ncbi:hypothetical protein K8I61_20620 [bacterium]|nr:hypothetical protein [bacterium]
MTRAIFLMAIFAALAGAMLVAACGDLGDGADPDTGAADDDTAAADDDPADGGDDDTNAGDDDARDDDDDDVSDDAPRFWEDVAPIIYNNCLDCHQTGGLAPMALETYDDAVRFAPLIKSQTASRAMPPWNPDNSGACNTYEDARWLTDAQIKTIGDWVDGGRPEGDPAKAPDFPDPPEGLDTVTHVIDPGIDFVPDASVDDDYRCFIVDLDPALTEDQFITAFQIKPGDLRMVHHVIVYALDTAMHEAKARALDREDAIPGYACFGDSGVQGARWLMSWAGGGGAKPYPERTGLRLVAGRPVVIQVHYDLRRYVGPDRTTVDVTLAPSVEIEGLILLAFNDQFYLPPGEERVTITKEFPIPGATAGDDVLFHGVFPHMHFFATEQRIGAWRNDEETCLLQVNKWDFHWQGYATYSEAIPAKVGDTMRLSCTYDTRGAKGPIYWGEGLDDEMCITQFYITPYFE